LEVSKIGDADKLKRLLNAGVNIEARDVNGSTPILIATANNHTNIVKILLDAGANPNEKNRWQDTTLVWAAHFNNVEMAKLLVAKEAMLEYINGQTALHFACWRGDVNIVKYFLTIGADINKKDHDGMTPLAYALKDNKTAIVEHLKSQGAIT
jgi:ankyrin repeat protein